MFILSQFVAHSNCQQKLVEIWFTGIRKVSKMNQIFVLLLILLFIFLLPFTVVVYIVAPKSKVIISYFLISRASN